jgi:hypothetical protein
VTVSMASAVPAGDVMAREEVLGIVSPAAATMETSIGVVRFPGKPDAVLVDCGSWPGQPVTGLGHCGSEPKSLVIAQREG